ncbi:MAG: hypothetical protein Athens101410_323 [Parcubacteria group bacterium Athens1014_10]|nr:MAG: hypothetical protein Athens101410_323 [Parcubacteria group bacterium Athens1014_10]TSD05959.1 MAG: hypothetical protein Athens071412_106 [Parcubacteria group bacterium Athens0714_12]
MIQKGIATFTLDYGKCPKWLFERMVKLGREIIEVMNIEYGPDEFIKRIADPVWFQSLGTVLAFDWNASGLTTILTAALKEALRRNEKELGIFICGGKGKTSRKTPEQIKGWGSILSLPAAQVDNLVYNSRMAAKVDSALVQDGFQIYHHTFFFSKNGAWAVVQQGMNAENQTARRYHWYSKKITDLVSEPHSGIASQMKSSTLDLTAKKSGKTRETSKELVQGGYASLMKDIKILRKHSSKLSQMISLKCGQRQTTFLNLENKEFHHHPVEREDFSKSKYLEKVLWQVCERRPESYENLLSLEGVGPKTIRALSLTSEVIYGAKPSYEDPARYSFAHGGKDATPYPVDRETYDATINFFNKLIQKTKMPFSEKKKAMAKLERNRN